MPAGCWYDLIEQGLEADRTADRGAGRHQGHERSGAIRKFTPETGSRARRPPRAGEAAARLADAVRRRPKPPRARTAAAVRAPLDDERHAFGGQARRAPPRAGARHARAPPDAIAARRSAGAARRGRAALSRAASKLDDAERTEIAEHTLRLLGDLRFDKLFLPGSRAEVSIVGRLDGRPVSGQVDRLVVTPDEVLIADYKTNRPAPRSLDEAKKRHADYVRQLALYRAVLAQLYPGRPVRAALLWTDTPDLMEIPAADLDAALAILTSA